MFWGVAMSNGLIFLRKVPKKYASLQYIDILERYAVPIMNLNGNSNSFLIQDNSRIHTAKIVKEWLINHSIRYIEWPSNSPDINIFENVWKMISDIVYSSKQCNNINDLIDKIHKAVHEINVTKREIIKSMFVNYNHRLTNLLLCRGNRLK